MEISLKALNAVLKAVANTSPGEVTVSQSADGWRMTAMSQDHVSLVDARLLPGSFGETPEDAEFTLNPSLLLSSLAGTDGNASFARGEGRYTVSCGPLSVTNPLIAREGRPVRIPNLADPDVAVTVSPQPFATVLAKAPKGASSVVLNSSAEGFSVSASDIKGASAVYVIPEKDCAMLYGIGRAMYSAELWESFLKTVPKGEDVTVEFSADAPAKASYGTDEYSVEWIVAPRIGDD